MNWQDGQEENLKKLWTQAHILNGKEKESLLEEFWKEYRLLRKNRKFQKALFIKNESTLLLEGNAS